MCQCFAHCTEPRMDFNVQCHCHELLPLLGALLIFTFISSPHQLIFKLNTTSLQRRWCILFTVAATLQPQSSIQHSVAYIRDQDFFLFVSWPAIICISHWQVNPRKVTLLFIILVFSFSRLVKCS